MNVVQDGYPFFQYTQYIFISILQTLEKQFLRSEIKCYHGVGFHGNFNMQWGIGSARFLWSFKKSGEVDVFLCQTTFWFKDHVAGKQC